MSDSAPAPDQHRPPRRNPYVGLVPFGPDDVEWFFGRDSESKIIGANLRSSRLTLLYGASGVGKSSVLQAAVLPSLRAVIARDRAVRERETPDARALPRFAVATFSDWRDAPLDGLMRAVADSVAEATGERVEPWVPGTPLRDTLAGWLRHVRALLIVLDQFEEYFLYHPHAEGPGTFAGEFVEIVGDAGLRVNILLSLREDELAKLDRFQGRVPGLFDNPLRVEHLDLKSARRAIHGPKDEYNARLPAGADPARIDEELVEQVLDEVRTRAVVADEPRGPDHESTDDMAGATDRVETPLLQLVMQRLWDAAAAGDRAPHVRLQTLREELGGTENIVRRHLEDALAALSDADRDLAVDLLRPLVSPTGTKIAWRAADLAHWARCTVEQVAPIVGELASGQRRILRTVMPPPSQADQSPRYEIFHDVLAAPILAWCAEREEERARRELAAEVEEQARERERAEREARLRRRRRIFAGGALALVALSLVAASVALHRGKLSDSRALAASAVAQLPVDPERSLLLAARAVDRHDTAEAVQSLRLSLTSSYVRARLEDGQARRCGGCAALETAPGASTGAVLALLAVAPDGRTVAAVRAGRLRLWQPRAGGVSAPRLRTGEVTGVAFTPDARRLFVVGRGGAALLDSDGTHAVRLAGAYEGGATAPGSRHVVTVGQAGATVWDVRTGFRLARLSSGAYLNAAFRSDGAVVLQDNYGALSEWRWRSGRTRTLAPAPEAPRFNVQYAPLGRFLVDSATAGKVRVVGPNGSRRILPPGSPGDPLDGAYISPDGSRIATVRESRVGLWRSERPWTARAQRVAELVHGDAVTAVAFTPDSALIATASSDGVARVWESATGGLVAALTGHTAGLASLAFSSGGRFLTTVADDLTVRLWDLGPESVLRVDHGVDAIALTRGGGVALVEGGGAFRLWQVPRATAEPAGLRETPRRRGDADDPIAAADLHPTSVAVTSDDRSAVVGYASSDDSTGRAALVDRNSGDVRAQFARGGPVRQVSVDRDGALAAVVQGDPPVAAIWDLRAQGRARQAWRVPIGEAEGITDVAISPDGRRLLVTTIFGAAAIFDLKTHAERHPLARGRAANPGPEAFYRGTFSPDGRTVAVAGSRDVRLWDTRTGAEHDFRLAGHTSVLKSVAFDAAGRRIVTASADGTTRVWDARDGTILAVLDRHAGGVNDAAFLPDGTIVSAGEDQTVRVYPCSTCAAAGTLLAQARRQVTRSLTARERAQFAD